MAGPTLKHVARLASVAPVTVSRVVNGAENVTVATREKILAIIRDVGYSPNVHAANLRREGLRNAREGNRRDRPRSAEERLVAGAKSDHGASGSGCEGEAFMQQILQLRRDLNRLMRQAERMRTCVDTIQQICLDKPDRHGSR